MRDIQYCVLAIESNFNGYAQMCQSSSQKTHDLEKMHEASAYILRILAQLLSIATHVQNLPSIKSLYIIPMKGLMIMGDIRAKNNNKNIHLHRSTVRFHCNIMKSNAHYRKHVCPYPASYLHQKMANSFPVIFPPYSYYNHVKPLVENAVK